MRLFVCVRPPLACLEEWRRFRAAAPSWPLRWISPDLLHITVTFLGETAPTAEPKIIAALKAVAPAFAPFSLRLKAGGALPLKGAPSIFWAGVTGDTDRLASLVTAVEQSFAPLGFVAEQRKFLPHVTVARVSAPREERKGLRWLSAAYHEWIAAFESAPFVVQDVTLMQSLLSARGPRYVERASVRF